MESLNINRTDNGPSVAPKPPDYGRKVFEGRLQYADFQLLLDGHPIEDRETALQLQKDLAFAITRLQRYSGKVIEIPDYTIRIENRERPSGRRHDYTGD